MKSLYSSLLLILIAFLGLGIVQVYSSSYVFSTENYGDGLYFFKKQLLFVVLGIFILIATLRTPWNWIQRWGWITWLISSFFVFLTYIPGLGVRVGGAQRWLQGPLGFRFEPTEFLKVTFVIFLASLFCRKQNFLNRFPLWLLLVIVVVPIIAILRQPDFGSFSLILIVGLGLLFVYGLPWKYIVASVVTAVPSFYFLVMMVPYRKARVMAFLDPWADPEHKGFQVIQSLLSFHSGGVTGVGLGQGQGKLLFLPEAHTDFTMAVLGEEMGFIGFIIVLSLYAYVVFRAFQLAYRSRDLFDKTMALGLGMIFGFSVFINSGVALGILPTKGMTLPFLSYGGSSLLALCFLFGLLIHIENSVESDKIFRRRR